MYFNITNGLQFVKGEIFGMCSGQECDLHHMAVFGQECDVDHVAARWERESGREGVGLESEESGTRGIACCVGTGANQYTTQRRSIV